MNYYTPRPELVLRNARMVAALIGMPLEQLFTRPVNTHSTAKWPHRREQALHLLLMAALDFDDMEVRAMLKSIGFMPGSQIRLLEFGIYLWRNDIYTKAIYNVIIDAIQRRSGGESEALAGTTLGVGAGDTPTLAMAAEECEEQALRGPRPRTARHAAPAAGAHQPDRKHTQRRA